MGRQRGTCSVDGCDRAHNARGWCQSHYARWRSWGDVKPDLPLRKPVRGICSVQDCGRPRNARGWCATHYSRWMLHGDVQAHVPVQILADECVVEGCDNEHKARGWCMAHYGRWQRHGDVLADKPLGVRRRPTGATFTTADGYAYEKVADDDPHFAMSDRGWITQHRLVMARTLGRDLEPNEHVHHINGIRSDNRPENLELWEVHHPYGKRADDPHCATCQCESAKVA